MATRDEYAAQVAAQFIEQIQQGTAPWRQKWEPGELAVPVNLVSGNPYHGFNTMLLTSVAISQGYKDPRWMTYKQAQEAGGQVRRGEKGAKIVYFTHTDRKAARDEEGNIMKDAQGKTIVETFTREYPVFKVYTVFNAAQVDGIQPHIPAPVSSEQLWENQERAEAILAGSGAKIRHIEGGNSNFYSPERDDITLVSKAQFPTMIDYYSVAFHELSHWTGHPTRLGRDLNNKFGTAAYAQEELRAEIGQFMVCQQLGLGYEPYQLEQSSAYLDSWVKVLQDTPQEILAASADAQKISTYIMSFDQQLTPEIDKNLGKDTTPMETRVATSGALSAENPQPRHEVTRGENGEIESEKWFNSQGQLHRDGAPALVSHSEGVSFEQWYQNGQLHREDGPAHTVKTEDGRSEEGWYQNGKLHRDGAPAKTSYSEDGSSIKEWYQNGQRHREDGPAWIARDYSGSEERWYQNGQLHRDGAPAVITYDREEGRTEQWYQHGQPVPEPVTPTQTAPTQPTPGAPSGETNKSFAQTFKQTFFKQLNARFSGGNPSVQRQAMSAETALHNMEEVNDKSRQDYALAASGNDKPRRKPHRSR